jgi:hypothetical protein
VVTLTTNGKWKLVTTTTSNKMEQGSGSDCHHFKKNWVVVMITTKARVVTVTDG